MNYFFLQSLKHRKDFHRICYYYYSILINSFQIYSVEYYLAHSYLFKLKRKHSFVKFDFIEIDYWSKQNYYEFTFDDHHLPSLCMIPIIFQGWLKTLIKEYFPLLASF